MSDEAKAAKILMDVIKDVVLPFEIDHNGHAVSLRYRPYVALDLDRRVGGYETTTKVPVMTALTFYADLVRTMAVDGQAVQTATKTMTVETYMLIGQLAAPVLEHAKAWMQDQTDTNGEYIQRAARRLKR